MNTTDLFLDKYRELEVAVRQVYKLDKYESAISFLKKQKSFEKHSADIDYISDIRNLLSHNRKISGEYAVQPSGKVIDFIDFLINEIYGRKRCRHIAVKFSGICKQNLKGNVNDTMKIMNQRNFTHIPIVDNNRVIGVFSRNSIFTYVAENGACRLSENPNLTFADIAEYIKLEGREKEEYIFVKSNMFLDELDTLFDEISKKGRRVGLVFLTKNGTPNEPITGMLTPWDVISAE
ncbi:MAG: CBS domain-containing protein [Clostridia bacterium]|nr:CBS domain-containing protein [Clostridia bacterium]